VLAEEEKVELRVAAGDEKVEVRAAEKVEARAERERLEERLRPSLDADWLRLRDEMRRVRALGASSSSESLQPRPVVSPMPPRRVLPSRWRTRRLGVSRVSRGRRSVLGKRELAGEGTGDGARDSAEWGSSFEWGERKPWCSMSCLLQGQLGVK
jgi:hypothetical protein